MQNYVRLDKDEKLSIFILIHNFLINFDTQNYISIDNNIENPIADQILFEKLMEICEKYDISSVSKMLLEFYKNSETFPSNCFNPKTDHFLAPEIVKIIFILRETSLNL